MDFEFLVLSSLLFLISQVVSVVIITISIYHNIDIMS